MVNTAQRLRILRAEIESAERNAAAERAFAATGASDNPWKGAVEKRDALLQEKHALELQLEGEALSGKLERLRQLDAELAKAQEARTIADEAVRIAAEHEAVQRWIRAGSTARQLGYAQTLESEFRPWFLSRRERYAGLTMNAAFFMDATRCPAALLFLESERGAICRWHEAVGEARKQLVIWSALAEQRALLLREAPELASVA
jgi:hypothetical protein